MNSYVRFTLGNGRLFKFALVALLAASSMGGQIFDGDGSDEPGFVPPPPRKETPPPPPANMSGGETFVPYPPPPATPASRSEKKNPPKPPTMFTKLTSKYGELDWNARPNDLNNLAGNITGFLYCTGQYLVGERGADVALAVPARKKVDRFADDKELQAVYRPGEWNDFRIVAKGGILVVWINGVRMVSVADSRKNYLPDTGYISIQVHKGHPMKAEFRDLRVRKDDVALDSSLEIVILQRLENLESGDAPSFEGADWIWHPKVQNVNNAKVAFRALGRLGEVKKVYAHLYFGTPLYLQRRWLRSTSSTA